MNSGPKRITKEPLWLSDRFCPYLGGRLR